MNKVLIVVDVQNDFIDGSLKNEEAIKKVPNIVNYIKNFDGKYIVTTMDTHNENYFNTLEGKKLPVKHCIFKSDGWKLNKDIEEAINAKKINQIPILKNTFGSVSQLPGSLSLIKNIYGVDIDEIVFVGFCTDICVVSNALILRANYPNVRIAAVEDCCAGTSIESHNAAITVMKSCQIDIE